jgi:hypothetical protein
MDYHLRRCKLRTNPRKYNLKEKLGKQRSAEESKNKIIVLVIRDDRQNGFICRTYINFRNVGSVYL